MRSTQLGNSTCKACSKIHLPITAHCEYDIVSEANAYANRFWAHILVDILHYYRNHQIDRNVGNVEIRRKQIIYNCR